MSNRRVRIAAMADIHCTTASTGRLAPLFAQAARSADVLLLCGDLTDYGLPQEAEVLAGELAEALGACRVLAVLGNHDHEAGTAAVVSAIIVDSGVSVLDGTTEEVLGVGFTGVKGFGGGFTPHELGAWGEAPIKAFVREARHEAAKLETGLARIGAAPRVVLMHYSPIRGTVVGESSEVYAFLGSSHLERVVDRYPVAAVFHGHAHKGRREGRTRGGAPVYNVSLRMLTARDPGGPPFRIIEIDGRPPDGTAIA